MAYGKFERGLDRLLKKAKTFEAFVESVEKRYKMTFTEEDIYLYNLIKDKWDLKEKGKKTIAEVFDEVIDFTDAFLKSRDGRIFKCPDCSVIFTDTVTRITCSKHCQYEWMFLYRKYKDTKIEKIMESWLKISGVKYEKQKYLNLDGVRTITDFFLPDRNMAIYVDGDYIHALPHKKVKDAFDNMYLKLRGYEIFRISGSALKAGDAPLMLWMDTYEWQE